jgi:hypothetical protein
MRRDNKEREGGGGRGKALHRVCVLSVNMIENWPGMVLRAGKGALTDRGSWGRAEGKRGCGTGKP